MKCFNQISQSAGYAEDNVSVSITVCGGSYGGGSEVLIVEVEEDGTDSKDSHPLGFTGKSDNRF